MSCKQGESHALSLYARAIPSLNSVCACSPLTCPSSSRIREYDRCISNGSCSMTERRVHCRKRTGRVRRKSFLQRSDVHTLTLEVLFPPPVEELCCPLLTLIQGCVWLLRGYLCAIAIIGYDARPSLPVSLVRTHAHRGTLTARGRDAIGARAPSARVSRAAISG
jgi:hypothetical protein